MQFGAAGAINVLTGMRDAKPVAPVLPSAPASVPLSNRIASAPKPMIELAGSVNHGRKTMKR